MDIDVASFTPGSAFAGGLLIGLAAALCSGIVNLAT